MRLVDGEIVIATLSGPDFERARWAVEGFAEWATYEDYQCDRDGWLIGLASAGQAARFTPISIDHFLSWTACASVAPTVEQLDEFAELVESFRRNPQSRFKVRLSHEFPGARRAFDGRFYVPVDARSYWEWLECLQNSPSDLLLNAYAGLLLELWADKPSAPTFAEESSLQSGGVIGRRSI
jgi:hypothetical protein